MRYDRQILIPQIGQKGQERLSNATVLVVGAGGLGAPVLTYLACAGVGTIRLVDGNTVDETNLNRQFLHTSTDMGRKKSESAYEKLHALNEHIAIQAACESISHDNAARLLDGVDVVVDCVDNDPTRLLVNRVCLRCDIPLVEAGVRDFCGYVMAVRRESSCLRCMGLRSEAEPPKTPIIGCTAGILGSMQSSVCIQILLGIGKPPWGSMLLFDGWRNTLEHVEIARDPNCPERHRA